MRGGIAVAARCAAAASATSPVICLVWHTILRSFRSSLMLLVVLAAVAPCLDADVSLPRVAPLPMHVNAHQLQCDHVVVVARHVGAPRAHVGHAILEGPCKPDLQGTDNAPLAAAVHTMYDGKRQSVSLSTVFLGGAGGSVRHGSPPVVLATAGRCLLSGVSADVFSEPVRLPHTSMQRKVGARVGKRTLWAKGKGIASRWLDFEDAKSAVRLLEHTRRSDFWEWWKRERPVHLPYNPDKAYRKSGWSSWGDFLGCQVSSSGSDVWGDKACADCGAQPVTYGRLEADGQSWKDVLCTKCGNRAIADAQRVAEEPPTVVNSVSSSDAATAVEASVAAAAEAAAATAAAATTARAQVGATGEASGGGGGGKGEVEGEGEGGRFISESTAESKGGTKSGGGWERAAGVEEGAVVAASAATTGAAPATHAGAAHAPQSAAEQAKSLPPAPDAKNLNVKRQLKGGALAAVGVLALHRRCAKCPQWACFGPRFLPRTSTSPEGISEVSSSSPDASDEGKRGGIGTRELLGGRGVADGDGGKRVPGENERTIAKAGSGRQRKKRLLVRHCRRHAEKGEVDLIHLSKCKHAGCSKIPSFGPEGGQPEYCKVHCAVTHKGLVGYWCSFAEGCSMRAAYGEQDVGTPRFCAKHRSEHHIDVLSRRCAFPEGCMRRVTKLVSNVTSTTATTSFSSSTTATSSTAAENPLQAHVQTYVSVSAHSTQSDGGAAGAGGAGGAGGFEQEELDDLTTRGGGSWGAREGKQGVVTPSNMDDDVTTRKTHHESTETLDVHTPPTRVSNYATSSRGGVGRAGGCGGGYPALFSKHVVKNEASAEEEKMAKNDANFKGRKQTNMGRSVRARDFLGNDMNLKNDASFKGRRRMTPGARSQRERTVKSLNSPKKLHHPFAHMLPPSLCSRHRGTCGECEGKKASASGAAAAATPI